ncbi:MAG: hypothetical protein K2W96_04390 [Gemmataceae bacterium]|nr:hypothetical protein [Gemmataceae bacterium]
MPWVVVERLGRAGSEKRRAARQREWDRKHGPGRWAVGYVIDGAFVLQEEALASVYQRSYDEHLENHPADLAELLSLAKSLRNPHAEAATGVDLQVPAILSYLGRHGLALAGSERVDIGTWDGQRSHPISVRLSPLHVRCALDRKLTLEEWWQSRKRLAAWEEE